MNYRVRGKPYDQARPFKFFDENLEELFDMRRCHCNKVSINNSFESISSDAAMETH